MKLFRPRGRNGAGAASSPVAQAIALYGEGRYAAAEAEARAVAESRSWRRDDPYVPLARSVAAVAMGAQGRHAEAVAAYDAVLPDFGRIFGAEDVQTLKVRSDRAQQLTRLGRYAECEAECAAVARAADRGGAPDMPLVAAAARNGLVYALNGQGRHQEAEATARDALGPRPAPNRFTLVLRLGLARSLNGQARHEEALAEAERAAELGHGLPENLRRAETGAADLIMATALRGLGRADEARFLASAAQDACLAAFGPGHHRTAEARALLDGIGTA